MAWGCHHKESQSQAWVYLEMIRRLADDKLKCQFALSLHAAVNDKRNRLAPFNLQHPV